MPTPSKLHSFCGKAGAGKSTLAAGLAADERAVLICEDVWLARLYGDQMKTFEDYRRVAEKLKSVVGPLAVDLLRAGNDVVLDFPGNTRLARQWFKALAGQAGAEYVLHFVDTSEADCLQRIGKRNVERPEGSHELTPEQFAHISSFFEAPTGDEGIRVVPHRAGGS